MDKALTCYISKLYTLYSYPGCNDFHSVTECVQNRALFTWKQFMLFVVKEMGDVQMMNKCTLISAAEAVIYKCTGLFKLFMFSFRDTTAVLITAWKSCVVYREIVILKMH